MQTREVKWENSNVYVYRSRRQLFTRLRRVVIFLWDSGARDSYYASREEREAPEVTSRACAPRFSRLRRSPLAKWESRASLFQRKITTARSLAIYINTSKFFLITCHVNLKLFLLPLSYRMLRDIARVLYMYISELVEPIPRPLYDQTFINEITLRRFLSYIKLC